MAATSEVALAVAAGAGAPVHPDPQAFLAPPFVAAIDRRFHSVTAAAAEVAVAVAAGAPVHLHPEAFLASSCLCK